VENKLVLLIGDSCVDEYYYGTCNRISPEAPVPVLKIIRTETKNGMSENVAANLKSFGYKVHHVTSTVKSVKRRYIDEKSKQHILRVDEDHVSQPFNPDQMVYDYDSVSAIVISDYEKGLLTYEAIEWLRQNYTGPIFIDTKKTDLARFEGCIVKINSLENERIISPCTDLIVTLGDRGASYQGTIYPAEDTEVVDVCGAGDMFLAALTAKYINNQDLVSAIKFANRASAIAVRHQGVYRLTKTDIKSL
jgi:bifunctional ADP-heptose synthase (sugar kinase/adenylyltransferase)